MLLEPTPTAVAIDTMDERHWAAVRSIYQAGIDTGHATLAPVSGRGVGTKVLAALIERSEPRNVWTLEAGIFPENKASIAVHENLAFEVLGTRRRLGKMSFGPLKGQWRDVLLLERRSSRAGID